MKDFDPSSEFENDLRSAMTYLDPPQDLMERMIAAASRPTARTDRFTRWIPWPEFLNLAVWRRGLLWVSVATSISFASVILFHLEGRHAQQLKATRDFVTSQQITEEVLTQAREDIRESERSFEQYKREIGASK